LPLDRENNADEQLDASMVLYCVLCRAGEDGAGTEFFVAEKRGSLTFPATRFRPHEDLYSALTRVMEEDLGLAPETYYPEREYAALPRAGTSPRYPGMQRQWYLYPVALSLTDDGWRALESSAAPGAAWLWLATIKEEIAEPNVQAIADYLRGGRSPVQEPADEEEQEPDYADARPDRRGRQDIVQERMPRGGAMLTSPRSARALRGISAAVRCARLRADKGDSRIEQRQGTRRR
jgi:hypothetical protein